MTTTCPPAVFEPLVEDRPTLDRTEITRRLNSGALVEKRICVFADQDVLAAGGAEPGVDLDTSLPFAVSTGTLRVRTTRYSGLPSLSETPHALVRFNRHFCVLTRIEPNAADGFWVTALGVIARADDGHLYYESDVPARYALVAPESFNEMAAVLRIAHRRERSHDHLFDDETLDAIASGRLRHGMTMDGLRVLVEAILALSADCRLSVCFETGITGCNVTIGADGKPLRIVNAELAIARVVEHYGALRPFLTPALFPEGLVQIGQRSQIDLGRIPSGRLVVDAPSALGRAAATSVSRDAIARLANEDRRVARDVAILLGHDLDT